MHEARLGSHDLGEMSQEGDHVVLGCALDRVDAVHIEDGVAALLPDGARGLLGDDPEFGHGVGRMRLDLEPDAEAGLRVPDRGHLGAGIAGDHCTSLKKAGS